MKKLIKDISSIQTGLFAKPAGVGELVYLQSRHFDEYGQLHSVLHPDLPAEGISVKHLLKDGDVLFAAKGTKNFATVFENHNEPSVASTSFFILRIFDDRVVPHYLSWYLNSFAAQSFLKSNAIGTSLPSISKSVLERLEIPIPDINKQLLVLKIIESRTKESALIKQLESLRDILIQEKIYKSIN